MLSLLLFGAGCSSGSDDGSAAPTTIAGAGTTTLAVDVPGATPKPTLREAVEALLTAEKAGDPATSFRLLDAEGHAKYPEESDWAERRTQVAPITAFSIDQQATTDRSVVAVVEHEPGLDPFIGLSAAKERQTWKGSRTPSGFLVSPEPNVQFVLPPEKAIPTEVQNWAEAVQACDQKKAKGLQAVELLFDTSTEPTKLCGSKGEVSVGAVQPLAAGPASADLVAQYSSDVLNWARTVQVSGPADFTVVVAPIGDRWKVLGVGDSP